MRTKAEALATPMAGDEYAKQRRTKAGISIVDGKIIVSSYLQNIIHDHTHTVENGLTTYRRESLTIDRFRRWAMNAEYLGGLA
tara:strand:- start:198 stop:446 length:249 start_codon:yes stop_codon:yes gene_type:complete